MSNTPKFNDRNFQIWLKYNELNFEDLMTILNVKKSSRDVRFNQIRDLLDSFTKFNISTNIRVY